MPNTPVSLQLPPPTTKGTTSEATMLQTFPDINVTVQGMATMWLLSKQSSDFVSPSSSILIPSQSRPPPSLTLNVPLISPGRSRPVPRATFQWGGPLQVHKELSRRSSTAKRWNSKQKRGPGNTVHIHWSTKRGEQRGHLNVLELRPDFRVVCTREQEEELNVVRLQLVGWEHIYVQAK